MSVENKNYVENTSTIDIWNKIKEALKEWDINEALNSRLSMWEAYCAETQQILEWQVHIAEQCLNFSEEKTLAFCNFFDTNLLQTI